MNPITRIAPVTDEEAARTPQPGTLSDLARQITATPITTSHASSARILARNRRRRLLLGAPLAAGLAAVVVIVALATAGVTGARQEGTGLTAYVVKRVGSALSAAGPAEIAQVTVTTRSAGVPGGTTTTEEWAYGEQWRSVTYSPAGHPVYDEGFSTASVYTLVGYSARTWARQPGLGRPSASLFDPRSCAPVVAAPGRAVPVLFQPGLPDSGFSASSPPATVARDLRTAVSCGTLAVAGRQRVDGVEAIELTSTRNSVISETIWVSADTYLPVRVVISDPGTPVTRQTADITWLTPTAQNLARLTVSVPAGFRQVPLPEAVTPILPQIPGGPLPRPSAPCVPASAGPECRDRTSASGSGS